MKCKETTDEEESFNIESFSQLSVHIGGGYSTLMHTDILKVIDNNE